MYKDKGITKVVGIESRGFIMGGALAARLGAGFVMARKPGKLPAEVVEETYAKSMEPTPFRYIKTPSMRTTWFCCTMIYWLPAEPWRPLIAWYKDVAPKDFHQFHYRTGRSERQKGIPRRYHGGYTAYFIVSHNMSIKTGPIIVHNKRDLWNEMDDETERYISSGCKIYNVTA